MVPSLGLLASGVGCSEWPRFSHPQPGPTTPFDRITVKETLEEPAGLDWPNSPKDLPVTESSWLGEPLVAVEIHGVADPVAQLINRKGTLPFDDCLDQVDKLPFKDAYYDGDVDWIHLKYATAANADDYGLCLILDTYPAIGSPPCWDLIAYSYANGCIKGDYLTFGSDDSDDAAYTKVGDHNYIEPGPHSDLAMYIAGSNSKGCAIGGKVPIDYYVYAYPIRDPVGCEELTPEFFQTGGR